MREALRSAKQRHRTSIRPLQNKQQNVRTARNYWNDNPEKENDVEIESDTGHDNEDE